MQTTIELPPPVEMTMPFSQVLGRRRSRREFKNFQVRLSEKILPTARRQTPHPVPAPF